MNVMDQWHIDWSTYLSIWKTLPKNVKKVSKTLGVKESFLTQVVEGIFSERQDSQRQEFRLHRRIFMALALQDLVHGIPIMEVAIKYKAIKGLLQSLQSDAGTCAGMVTRFCSKLGWFDLEFRISKFQGQLLYGAGMERAICDLVAISLLDRFHAQVLYNAGYRTLSALATANPVSIEMCLQNAVLLKNKFFTGENEEVKASGTTWCARKDVTESEAAVLVVSEARTILSKQLNMPVPTCDEEVPTSGSSQNHLPVGEVTNSPLGIAPESNGADPKWSRKRTREIGSPQGATTSYCPGLPSLCEKQTDNSNSNHFVESSSVPNSKSLPAFSSCSEKKAKLSETPSTSINKCKRIEKIM